jgi:hypothetical protein
MPTEPKQEQSYLPWIAVAVLAFMLFQKQVPAPGPTPVPPAPVVNVESVVAGIFPAQAKGYAAIFSQAANKVQSKELATEESLFSFLKVEAENVRAASAVEFDKLLNESIPDGNFDGTEAVDVATFLERVAKAFGGAK